jgi:hypothetical protein
MSRRVIASDRAQRLSGIETAIQAIDGLNFMKTLTQLCLVNYGKVNSLSYREQVSKNVFLSHLYIKTNILPRQARDTHRENSQKEWRFSSGGEF